MKTTITAKGMVVTPNYQAYHENRNHEPLSEGRYRDVRTYA